MRVGIDGYNLALPRGTGVATYARTLAAAVKQLGHQVDLLFGLNIPRKVSPELRESVFFGRLRNEETQRATWRKTFRRLRTLPIPRKPQEIQIAGRVVRDGLVDSIPEFDRLFNSSELFDVCALHFRRYGRFVSVRLNTPPDIMHWTYPLPIRVIGAQNIYTLHDLVPLRLPHLSLEDKRYYDALVRACVAQGDHIVTVSDTSRQDILDLLGADPGRVTNTGQSVEMPQRRDHAVLAERLERLFDLRPKGYFLFFGAIEPKKNVGRLIEAYLESGIETPLVIVGGDAWNAGQELRLLNGAHGTQLDGVSRIRRIGHLSREMLADLVAGARALAFPSLYEGFGLPVLEALSYGVPVMTSDSGSLPEVGGNAVLRVNPYRIDEMVAALRRLDNEASLRDRLSQAGPRQAAHYSMSVYRTRLAELYQRVADA